MAELILANPKYGDVIVFEGGEIINLPTINSTSASVLAPWRQ
jgi:hypothetical protein